MGPTLMWSVSLQEEVKLNTAAHREWHWEADSHREMGATGDQGEFLSTEFLSPSQRLDFGLLPSITVGH